jgi:hypothetical protein
MPDGRTDANPSCVYDGDPKFYVQVKTTLAAAHIIPQWASGIEGLLREFNGQIEALNTGRIGRARRIETAKEALLNAENGRAADPAGYQQARVNYYTLLLGDTWLTDERRRIQAAVVDPAVRDYQQRALNLQSRLASQDQYSDIVRNTSESVLSAKTNFEYVVNKFSEQLDKINVETKKKQMEAKDRDLSFMSSIDSMLNWVIIVLLLIAVGAVGYRIYLRYAWRFEKPTAIEVNV